MRRAPGNQKTEEKGLFPQISSDLLKPASLKSPLEKHLLEPVPFSSKGKSASKTPKTKRLGTLFWCTQFLCNLAQSGGTKPEASVEQHAELASPGTHCLCHHTLVDYCRFLHIFSSLLDRMSFTTDLGVHSLNVAHMKRQPATIANDSSAKSTVLVIFWGL